MLAAFLSLAGCVIKTFSRVFYIAPLFVLGGAHYLSVFSPEQLQALGVRQWVAHSGIYGMFRHDCGYDGSRLFSQLAVTAT